MRNKGGRQKKSAKWEIEPMTQEVIPLQTNNHSMQSILISNKEVWRSLMRDPDLYTPSESDIDVIIDDMTDYFKVHTEAIMFEEYLEYRELDDMTFYRWTQKFPKLLRKYNFVKMMIGIRREKAIAYGQMSGSLLFTQPHYHKRWRDTYEWKESIKAKQDPQPIASIQYLERAPDTGILTREEREREGNTED